MSRAKALTLTGEKKNTLMKTSAADERIESLRILISAVRTAPPGVGWRDNL